MEFIPISPRLMQHKKIIKLAHLMKYKPIEVWPRVIKLWAWAFENAQDGDVSVLFYEGLEVGLTEQILELPNKIVAGTFMAIMTKVGLLEQKEDKTVIIHDWFVHGAGSYLQAKQDTKISTRKSESARKAALARWHNKSKVDAHDANASTTQDADASPTHDAHAPDASVSHSAVACDSHMPNNSNNKNKKCVYTYAHIKDIVELYNKLCASSGMIPVPSPPGIAVVKKILKHLRAGRDDEFFRALFERAGKCAYLCGKNDNGFVADIFWLLDDEHIERILSGFYDDRANAKDDKLSQYFAPQSSEKLEALMILG